MFFLMGSFFFLILCNSLIRMALFRRHHMAKDSTTSIKCLLSLSINFAICNLPSQVNIFIRVYAKVEDQNNASLGGAGALIYDGLNSFIFLSNAINVLSYYTTMTKFRQHINRNICCCICSDKGDEVVDKSQTTMSEMK